jgi:hypothetical protein
MRLQLLRLICFVVLASLSLPTATQAQTPPNPEEQPATSRDDRRRDDERRRQWRERREQMASATSEERRQMRLDWRVSMLTRTYELTEEQQAKVRAEIQKMEKERRESLGPAADQLDRAQEQMQQYWRKRMASDDNDGRRAWREAMDDEEFAKLRERLQSLREQTSFDWQEHNERIEKLLPAEQVEAGRKRREEWMTRWTERRGDGDRWGNGDSRGGWGQRWSDRRRALEARVAPPMDSWDEFTQNLIEKYSFDSAQRGTAGAILKDVKDRALAVKKKQEPARSSLEDVKDRAERVRQAAELDKPINALFSELRSRLGNLVTERQRRQAGEV